MKHRQFKTECICRVMINEKTFSCSDLKQAKRKIYSLGVREQKYRVDVVDKKTGTINDIYLMKYTREGLIFQKQMFSRWKEEQIIAKRNQLIIFTTL